MPRAHSRPNRHNRRRDGPDLDEADAYTRHRAWDDDIARLRREIPVEIANKFKN